MGHKYKDFCYFILPKMTSRETRETFFTTWNDVAKRAKDKRRPAKRWEMLYYLKRRRPEREMFIPPKTTSHETIELVVLPKTTPREAREN